MDILKVEYRWQFTKWEQMEMLPTPIFPIMVINDELLEDNSQIEGFLEKHQLTFEEFTQKVPDGYCGPLLIIQ